MSDPRLGESFLRVATVRGEGKRGLNYQLASRSNFSYFLVQLPRPVEGRGKKLLPEEMSR